MRNDRQVTFSGTLEQGNEYRRKAQPTQHTGSGINYFTLMKIVAAICVGLAVFRFLSH